MTIALLVALVCHVNSLSTSSVVVDEDALELELRVQIASLVEVVDGLDADGDRLVTRSELAAREAAIADYVVDHFRIGARSGDNAARPVRLALNELRLGKPDAFALDSAVLKLSGELPAETEGLDIEVDLFAITSPAHRDLCNLSWNDAEPAHFVFARGSSAWSWPPPRRPFSTVAFQFARLGVEHILTGWDHIAFLIALLLSARGLKSLLLVVTAFTVAHSVTLALRALDLVDVPGHLVEITIALSIAYVAADNLLHPAARSRWIEALVFGLVHGLGFAGFLQASLVGEGSKTTALFAFNVGVELGQLVVVSVLASVLLLIARKRSTETATHLAPRWLRRSGSAVIVCLGLFWFVERAWL